MGYRRRAAVREEILSDLREGRYEAVVLLPTHRQMSRMYGASTHTIKAAVRELVDAGEVTVRQSVGTIAPVPAGEGEESASELAVCGSPVESLFLNLGSA